MFINEYSEIMYVITIFWALLESRGERGESSAIPPYPLTLHTTLCACRCMCVLVIEFAAVIYSVDNRRFEN